MTSLRSAMLPYFVGAFVRGVCDHFGTVICVKSRVLNTSLRGLNARAWPLKSQTLFAQRKATDEQDDVRARAPTLFPNFSSRTEVDSLRKKLETEILSFGLPMETRAHNNKKQRSRAAPAV